MAHEEISSPGSDRVTKFLEQGNFKDASAVLLRQAREQTNSEFGFVGVVLDGELLRLLAHKGFHWHETINREFYETMMQSFKGNGYLDFLETHNLVGRAILHQEMVFSNSPATDPHSGGVPAGHPTLHSFLGIPAIRGGTVVAMIGLANRKNGYTEAVRTRIQQMTPTLAALYDCYISAGLRAA
jgi:GAF domain-containing protein